MAAEVQGKGVCSGRACKTGFPRILTYVKVIHRELPASSRDFLIQGILSPVSYNTWSKLALPSDKSVLPTCTRGDSHGCHCTVSAIP